MPEKIRLTDAEPETWLTGNAAPSSKPANESDLRNNTQEGLDAANSRDRLEKALTKRAQFWKALFALVRKESIERDPLLESYLPVSLRRTHQPDPDAVGARFVIFQGL